MISLFFNKGMSKDTCKHCEQHGLPNVEFYGLQQPARPDQRSVLQAASEMFPTNLTYVNKNSSFGEGGRRGGKKKKNKAHILLSAALLLPSH